jgi:hypothetical protein
MPALVYFTPNTKPPQDGAVAVACFVIEEVIIVRLRPAARGASEIISSAAVIRDGEAILGDARVLPHEGLMFRVSGGRATGEEIQRKLVWFQVS